MARTLHRLIDVEHRDAHAVSKYGDAYFYGKSVSLSNKIHREVTDGQV